MDVNEVLLPGVGLRYEFTNADGDRIGIVARREGSFEVSRYSADDPDEAKPLFRGRDRLPERSRPPEKRTKASPSRDVGPAMPWADAPEMTIAGDRRWVRPS